LNLIGLPCGHGWYYNARNERQHPLIEILGDASPTAAPFAREFDGLLLHQVRHPLRVIGSLITNTLFEHYQHCGPEGEFLARHFDFGGDLLTDAMRYYVHWNARCERDDRYLRYRIEDLDADLLGRVAGTLGREVDEGTIRDALERVPTDANTYYRARSLAWGDLPDGPAKVDLIRMAAHYGYATA
jgi:hypothetical protein